MPITLSERTASLEGVCPIEEAETLLEWLRNTAEPQVDLAACEHLHAAILQTLLALRPTIAAMSSDPLLARLLAGAGVASERIAERVDEKNDPDR